MVKWFALVLVALATLVLPMGALAEDATVETDGSLLLRINGSATVPADDLVETAVVLSGDLTMDGKVTGQAIVVDGVATINGVVDGDLLVVGGTLKLGPNAVVDNVTLMGSTLEQDPGAVINGELAEKSTADFSLGRDAAFFSILFWIGMTLVSVVGAAIFAWLGRRQLFGSVETMRTDPLHSGLASLLLFIVLPVVAALALATIVGIPLGFLTLVIALPLLWFIGHIVFGTLIGSLVLKPAEHGSSVGRSIGSAVLGVVILALVSLVPFVALLVVLGGLLGAGAFMVRAVASATGKGLANNSAQNAVV